MLIRIRDRSESKRQFNPQRQDPLSSTRHEPPW